MGNTDLLYKNSMNIKKKKKKLRERQLSGSVSQRHLALGDRPPMSGTASQLWDMLSHGCHMLDFKLKKVAYTEVLLN